MLRDESYRQDLLHLGLSEEGLLKRLHTLAVQKLKDSGFTKMEIGMVDRSESHGTPQNTDINAGVWKDAIASRIQYVRRLASEDLSPSEIEDMLDEYYAGEDEATPWDFIKVEYKPRKKLSDFQYASDRRKEQVRKRIESHFGRY